jgi:putative adenylate-forming enzyme
VMRVIEALGSFWTTRRLSRPGLSRPEFEHLQTRALGRWLDRDLPQVSAYPTAPGQLTDLPITDKAMLMADFAAYNRPRITADEVRQALDGDCQVRGHTVGASTGTSGNRGYFVITDAERYRWLGALLAKTLADLLWHKQRVAILLPQDTRLYASARTIPRLQLRFFPLALGADHWQPALEAYNPTVIVAPPKVLRHLAETHARLTPTRLFSAAETLDPVDRPIIETAFRQRLHQIYMATEGLLATTCRHGTLHLAEDSVHFEYQPVGDGLVSPLITSFRRQAQIMARYQMNDLLRLSDQPCPCGSPLQAVAEVVGRLDDCFTLPGAQDPVLVTPDILRNAVLRADPGITDFRIWQVGPERIDLLLPPEVPAKTAEAARMALTAAVTRLGANAHITLHQQPLPLDVTRKLRRVECRLPKAPTQ